MKLNWEWWVGIALIYAAAFWACRRFRRRKEREQDAADRRFDSVVQQIREMEREMDAKGFVPINAHERLIGGPMGSDWGN